MNPAYAWFMLLGVGLTLFLAVAAALLQVHRQPLLAVLLSALISAGVCMALNVIIPPPTAPTRLHPPLNFGVASIDYEIPIVGDGRPSVRFEPTPCTQDGHVLPSAIDRKRDVPELMPQLRRAILRNVPDDPDNVRILLEVSVTNRGEPSIIGGWRLCIVFDQEPLLLMPRELKPEELSSFMDKTSLIHASFNEALETGHAVTGWLIFYLPAEVVKYEAWAGTLEMEDYLGRRFGMMFSGGTRNETE